MKEAEVLTEIWRGSFLEGQHRGHAVIFDAGGDIVASWGDPDAVVLPRSSCKMLQALPLVESGAAEAFGLSDAQLALAWGADDVDGTVVEEHIYHDAGATTPEAVKRSELVQWIRDAGRIPVERDTLYRVVWSADESLAQVGHAAPVST